MGFASLHWLGRRSSRITGGNWASLLAELREHLHLRWRVELLGNSGRTMPMTWGLWTVRVLLPEDSADWSAEQRKAVLLHELAHAKRWDCLTQLVAQATCGIYWFNPLVWFAWKRMQSERERACDDLVLSAGAKASAYAEQLLQVAAEMPAVRWAAAAIAIARPSKLEGRLLAILDVKQDRRAMTWGAAILAVVLVAAFAVPLAMVKAADEEKTDTTKLAPIRRFPDVKLLINNRRYGDENGLSGSLNENEHAICGHPGAVSDVSGKFLGSNSDGDVYQFTRRFPADAVNPADIKTTTRTVTYAGKRLMLFEDDVQQIVIYPPTESPFGGSATAPAATGAGETRPTFDHGIWNMPLLDEVRFRSPDAAYRPGPWFTLVNSNPCDSVQVNAVKLGLPEDAPIEEIVAKTRGGDLYEPELGTIQPIRGSQMAPLDLTLEMAQERGMFVEQIVFNDAIATMSCEEIARRVRSYNLAHPEVRQWRLKDGQDYAVQRADGGLSVMAVHGSGNQMYVTIIPIGSVPAMASGDNAPATQPPSGFGKVVDVNGAPIAGAVLRSTQSRWRATTDENGLFAYGGLWADQPEWLDVKAAGFIERDAATFQPDLVVAGQHQDTIELHRPARLEGRVLGPDGQPLAGANVSVDVSETYGSNVKNVSDAARATSNARGLFAIDNVPPGHVVLSCAYRSADGNRYATAIELQPADGQTLAALVPDLSKSIATVRGRVVDQIGKPLAGVEVNLAASWEYGMPPQARAAVKTDSQGRYELLELPQGPWRLCVNVGTAWAVVPVTLSDVPAQAADLVLPVVQTAIGRIHRAGPMNPQETVQEWLDATRAGDAEGALAMIVPDSSFGRNSGRIANLLAQVKHLSSYSESSEGLGKVATNPIDLGEGDRAAVTFKLLAANHRAQNIDQWDWHLFDITDEKGASLVEDALPAQSASTTQPANALGAQVKLTLGWNDAGRRIYRWSLKSDRPARLLSGWYSSAAFGGTEQVDAGAHRSSQPLPRQLGLETWTDGGWFAFKMLKGDDQSGFESTQSSTAIPPDAQFTSRTLPAGEPALLNNQRYLTLWMGQWIRDGKAVKTVRYLARLADDGNPASGFFDQSTDIKKVQLLPDEAASDLGDPKLEAIVTTADQTPATQSAAVEPAAPGDAGPTTNPPPATQMAVENRRYSREDGSRIVEAASAALNQARRLQNWAGRDIPASCWPEALKDLKPLRVEESSGNVRIVLESSEGIDRGLYVVPEISSTRPASGEGETVTPLVAGSDGFLEAAVQNATDHSRAFGTLVRTSPLYAFKTTARVPATEPAPATQGSATPADSPAAPEVSILDVEKHSLSGIEFWQPDGSPLRDNIRGALVRSDVLPPEQNRRPEFLVSLLVKNPPPYEVTQGMWRASFGDGAYGAMLRASETRPDLAGTIFRLSANFVKPPEMTDIRFGIPIRSRRDLLVMTGPRLDQITASEPFRQPDLMPKITLERDIDPAGSQLGKAGDRPIVRAQVEFPEALHWSWDWNVRVYGRDGKEVFANQFPKSGWEYDLADKSDISKVVVQGRSYEHDYRWATFPSIPLVPGKVAATQAAAAPPATNLASGAHVDLSQEALQARLQADLGLRTPTETVTHSILVHLMLKPPPEEPGNPPTAFKLGNAADGQQMRDLSSGTAATTQP